MRDGAGSFQIDNPEDGTPIREMFSFKERLLLITDKCTYEVQVADQIDPDRKNPNLPHNVQRKIFDYGIGSEPLIKILLQARTLFKAGFLPIDIELAQTLALDALKEFAAIDHVATTFKELQKSAVERYERSKQQPRSVTLPSIGNIDSHCKTLSQKAHHFDKNMLSIARLFLPAASNWDKLGEIVHAKFGDDDRFTTLMSEMIPNLKMILHLRDALEHQNKVVIVRDFSLEPDGTMVPPTIEMKFRTTVLPRSSIASFMEGLLIALPVYFEMLIVFLSSKLVQKVAGLPVYVSYLRDEFVKSHRVRFGYWAQMPDGRGTPFI